MNLNDFINAGTPKHNFKVVAMIGNTRLTKFVMAHSEDEAKSAINLEIKKEHPKTAFKIKEVRDLSLKEKQNGKAEESN